MTLHFKATPFVLTVTVALPCFLAVILPVFVTAATFLLLDLNVALPTLPVIFRVKVSPSFRLSFVLLSLGFLTVTVNFALASLLETVMVTLPCLRAVTFPLELTLATFGLLLLYLIF